MISPDKKEMTSRRMAIVQRRVTKAETYVRRSMLFFHFQVSILPFRGDIFSFETSEANDESFCSFTQSGVFYVVFIYLEKTLYFD